MTDRDALKILSLPPVEWPAAVEALNISERGELADILTHFAQQSAWLSVYAEQRNGCGCGDQGHESAAKAAQCAQVETRKALGFTYPKSGVLSL